MIGFIQLFVDVESGVRALGAQKTARAAPKKHGHETGDSHGIYNLTTQNAPFIATAQAFNLPVTAQRATGNRMKLQPDRLDVQSILGYGPGWVGLGSKGVAEKIEQSIVIGSRGEKFNWDCPNFEALTPEHFSRIAEYRPELVIFGSGTRLRFAHPSLLRTLIDQRIGVETMDTLAACRTYNILAGEGRQVIAALLIETVPPQQSKG